MNEWNEKPHRAASKLGLGPKDQRQVPLCPRSVEEENSHVWRSVLGDFT